MISFTLRPPCKQCVSCILRGRGKGLLPNCVFIYLSLRDGYLDTAFKIAVIIYVNLKQEKSWFVSLQKMDDGDFKKIHDFGRLSFAFLSFFLSFPFLYFLLFSFSSFFSSLLLSFAFFTLLFLSFSFSFYYFLFLPFPCFSFSCLFFSSPFLSSSLLSLPFPCFSLPCLFFLLFFLRLSFSDRKSVV